MSQFVLSLFPGADLLGLGFEMGFSGRGADIPQGLLRLGDGA